MGSRPETAGETGGSSREPAGPGSVGPDNIDHRDDADDPGHSGDGKRRSGDQGEGGGGVEGDAGDVDGSTSPMGDIDQQTLLWAIAGDDAAFARLIQHYDAGLCELVYAQVGDAELMDRVLASTYRKAYRALPRLRNATRPGAWLSGLAAKSCAEELRRQSQRIRTDRRSEPKVPRPEGARVDVSQRVNPVARGEVPPSPRLRPKPVELPDSVTGPTAQDDTEGDERVTLLPAEPDDVEIALTSPAAAEPAGPEPAGPEPVGDQPVGDEPAGPEPVGDQPVGDRGEPAAAAPGAEPAEADGSGDVVPPEAAGDEIDVRLDLGPTTATHQAEDPIDVRLDLGTTPGSTTADRGDHPAAPEQLTLPGTPPAHLPGFWNRLGRQLIAEREIPARPAPTVEQIRAARASTNAETVEGLGRGRRRLASPDRLVQLETPVTVEELAHQAGPGRRRTGERWRQVAVVLLAVVAVGSIVFLAFRIGGNAKQLNRTQMTNGSLAQKVSDTLSSSQTVSATFTDITTLGGFKSTPSQLNFDHNGSYRLRAADGSVDLAYDANTGTRLLRSTTAGMQQVEQKGLATGGPDPHALINPFFDAQLGQVLAALRAHPDNYVTSKKVGGHAVWQTEVELPHDNTSADRAILDVDQQLLVPASLEFRRGTQLLRIFQLSDVVLDQPLPSSTFTFPFSNDPVDSTDDGFVHTTLAGAPAQLGGFQPVTPKFLPDGYELAEVAVHKGEGTRTGPEGANPPSANVVSLTYRRGWETITLTTRTNNVAPGQVWQDPFVTTSPAPPADSVRISGGRFTGTDARRVSPTGGAPYLWGATDSLLFTVTGDLTPDDLVRVVASAQ